MFKPTKKQHVVNKAYADKNGGSGGSGGGTIMAIMNDDDSNVETLNKTVDEIVQMLSNGSSPFVVSFDVTPHTPVPFYNLGRIDKILFNDRNGRYEVYVSGQDGVLTYTSFRDDHPSRTLPSGESENTF